MDTYYLKLPKFKKSNYYGHYLINSPEYGLLSLGGVNHMVSLKFCQFKNQNDKQWKWNDIGWKWNEQRLIFSATFIEKDKLICCGGGSKYNKYVDVYNFKTNEMKQLSNMNENRVYSGICIDEFKNNKIFICAGYLSDHTVEHLDLSKNKWILLPKTTEKHSAWPLIWNDEPHIINIASTTTKRKSFSKLDLRENKWIDYMPNNKNSFDDLFGVTTKTGGTRLLRSGYNL